MSRCSRGVERCRCIAQWWCRGVERCKCAGVEVQSGAGAEVQGYAKVHR